MPRTAGGDEDVRARAAGRLGCMPTTAANMITGSWAQSHSLTLVRQPHPPPCTPPCLPAGCITPSTSTQLQPCQPTEAHTATLPQHHAPKTTARNTRRPQHGKTAVQTAVGYMRCRWPGALRVGVCAEIHCTSQHAAPTPAPRRVGPSCSSLPLQGHVHVRAPQGLLCRSGAGVVLMTMLHPTFYHLTSTATSSESHG